MSNHRLFKFVLGFGIGLALAILFIGIYNFARQSYNPNNTKRYHPLPIFTAVNAGDYDAVRELCKKGALLSVADDEYKTPLNLAIEKKDAAMVDLLLDLGADINFPDKDGKPPIFYAALDNYKAVEYLYVLGADIHVTDKNGYTLLTMAELSGNMETYDYVNSIMNDKTSKLSE